MKPTPNPPSDPLALRILRTIFRVALAAVTAALAGLLLCVVWPQLREVVIATMDLGNSEKAHPTMLVLFFLGLVCLAGMLSWLGRRLRWRHLATVGVLLAAVLVYLAWDDRALRRPQVMEDLFPAYPAVEARASYEVLMRYGKRHPAGRDFKESKLAWAVFDPEKPELWIKFVTANRAQIEGEWSALGPVRSWWAELNAFEHVVDLMAPNLDGEILAFRPVREHTQRACAIATLQALEGQGDAAIETLLPLIEVSRKMQETGRSLVIQMVAILIERMGMETAGFVLDRAPVSSGVRVRLTAVLAKPGGGEAGARRLISVEHILGRNTLAGDGSIAGQVTVDSPWRLILIAIHPFIYNPRATANLYGDIMAEAEDLIGQRRLPEFEERLVKFIAIDVRPRFKNFGGRLMAAYAIPSYNKVAKAYWRVQDMRAALLARLKKDADAVK